jgi:dTDP-4-dehydrorhamnose 3,5-epimerase
VRVTQGSVFDVVVDIRDGSPTRGAWLGLQLDAAEHKQIWIPPGLAHGFLVLSDSADFLYKTTHFYVPSAEGCIRWDDPDLAIAWPLANRTPSLSAKDAAAPRLRDI